MIKRVLRDHLVRLRRIPKYAKAHIVLAIEANNNYIIANDLANAMQRFNVTLELGEPRMEVVCWDRTKNGKPGVWIDENEKKIYVKHIESVLEEGNLRFAVNACSEDDARERFEVLRQLRAYREEFKIPDDLVFQKTKSRYTGKSNGCKDDRVSALGIGMFVCMRVRRMPEYREMAAQNGWRL